MNIIEILSSVCDRMSERHTFHFGDMYGNNLGLTAKHLENPVLICLPYSVSGVVLQSFDDALQSEQSYNLVLFFLRESELDQPYIERHDAAIQRTLDLIPEFMTRLNAALPKTSTGAENWRVQADKINLFDSNLDGVSVSLSIPVISTYCLP